MKILTCSVRAIPKSHVTPSYELFVNLLKTNAVGIVTGVKKTDVCNLYRVAKVHFASKRLSISHDSSNNTVTITPAMRKKPKLAITTVAKLRVRK
jgi:hypothetical protein